MINYEAVMFVGRREQDYRNIQTLKVFLLIP